MENEQTPEKPTTEARGGVGSNALLGCPPGSKEALQKGCTCPVMDNGHGKGLYFDKNGVPVFWFNLDCPIHGNAEKINGETILYPISECIIIPILSRVCKQGTKCCSVKHES